MLTKDQVEAAREWVCLNMRDQCYIGISAPCARTLDDALAAYERVTALLESWDGIITRGCADGIVPIAVQGLIRSRDELRRALEGE